jgi:hypothetical protein
VLIGFNRLSGLNPLLGCFVCRLSVKSSDEMHVAAQPVDLPQFPAMTSLLAFFSVPLPQNAMPCDLLSSLLQ